jgi:hypothetical protein
VPRLLAASGLTHGWGLGRFWFGKNQTFAIANHGFAQADNAQRMVAWPPSVGPSPSARFQWRRNGLALRAALVPLTG